MNSELKFGMNIHNGRYAAYPAENLEMNINTCKELGMEWIRFNQTFEDEESLREIKHVSDLCHANGMKLMLVVDTRKYSTVESLSQIEREMTEYFKNASAFLRDAVDVYQLFNEMDVHCMGGDIANIFLSPADGREKGEYDCILWERSIAAVKGALKGMKAGYPQGKTCLNFAWWHTALIYELYRQGLRWDITGLDWYSDCEEVSSIERLMEDVQENIPDGELMICEMNYWMNLHERYTPERKQALQAGVIRDRWQAEWLPEFIDKLEGYDNPRLKAVMLYELLDEPAYERELGDYTGESHFGFIECDEKGGNQVKKPAFYSLQERLKNCDAIAKTG